MTKTCSQVAIEDCKTANKIKYCYCKGDLCNREIVPTETTITSFETEAEDDEDSMMMEGSGSLEEEFENKRLETSSEGDVGIEVIRKQLPTTTKSVTLTTSRTENEKNASGNGNTTAQPIIFLYLISFLLFASLV